ncbi:hypothetical protein BGX28_007242 [Mortierella sp. GBA30]|nr:hypothetical protein BGX28_007242 [Mortierella sp. GBA30]
MIPISRQLTETDSMYNNPTEDGGSTKTAPSIKSVKSSTSSSASVKSGTNSTKSRSTTRSKSSTNSVPKSANWKAAVDPLGMSTKAVGPGFMPMFSTNLYAPGFQMPTNANAGAPKAHQAKQLKFVEKKRTGPNNASSAASTKSGKSGKSEKTAVSSSDRSIKSVKSTSSSTKSAFFSSFSGTSSLPPEIAGSSNGSGKGSSSSNSKDKAGGTEEDPKTKGKDSTSAPEIKQHPTHISEPLVVIEDHSSSSSAPSSQPNDRSALSPTTSDRRPSLAESIHLQPRTPHTPNELLMKRVVSWEYLGRVHHGQMAYYNTVVLTEADLRRFYTPDAVQKRTHQCFLLGTSIANVLDIPHLSDYAKSLSALLQEYEHFLSVESKSKMNFFKGGRRMADGEETGEYIHFEVRTVPFEMDYTVVFATLCEMIAQAYKKFDTHKSSIITDSDLFHKIDTRLKKISNNAARELEAMARDAMQEELNSLDPIGNLMVDWDQQAVALGH